jgi:hypothetical protein
VEPQVNSAPKVVPPAESDNSTLQLKLEDIRLENRATGIKTELGRGNFGGKIGSITGHSTLSSVQQEVSAARSTLIAHQPGRTRADDQYLPYITPQPVDKAGHVLFALDVPKVHAKTAKAVGKRASRIVINKSADRSAQISIEYYNKGVEAKKGITDAAGDWHDATAEDAVTRDVIEILSFNVSEIQRVKITLSTLSTLSEEKMSFAQSEEKVLVTRTQVDWLPFNCAEWCSCCVERRSGKECCICGWHQPFAPSSAGGPSCGKWCGFKCPEGCNACLNTPANSSGPTKCCKCCKDNCEPSPCHLDICWKKVETEVVEDTGEVIVDKKVATMQADFDLVSVTEIQFVLRDASHVLGEDNTVKFVWRVQGVGETETDLQYVLAEELKLPCQDPTSTARTLANLVHYLNA